MFEADLVVQQVSERKSVPNAASGANRVVVGSTVRGRWIQDSMGWSCYRHLRDSKVRIDKKRKNKATLIK